MPDKPTYEELAQQIQHLEQKIATFTRIENALQQNQIELDALFNKGPLAMLIMDRDRQVCRLNEAAVALAHRAQEDGIGRRSGDALRCVNAHEDPKGCGFGSACRSCILHQTVRDTFVSGRHHHGVEASLPYDAGDGAMARQVRVSTSLLKLPQGERVLVSLEDITERKRAETALRESEEKYRLLFDNTDALVSVYNRNGICQLMNRRVAGLFGGRPEDFIGRSFAELHPQAAPEFTDRIRQAIDSGISRDYEDRVDFPRGARWLLSRVHPVPDAQGKYQTAQIISQDITERKMAEAALDESEERFRALVEAAPMSVLLLRNGKYIFGNLESARLLGYKSPEGIVGVDALDPVAPEFRDRMRKRIARLEKGASNPPMEVQLVRSDGTSVWTISTSVIIQMDGEPTAVIVGQDITARKQAEEERIRMEAQVRQTQKLESIGRLAGGVAHDLNNLLSPILGYSELLLADSIPGGASKEPLEQILKAGERARDLVQQLLTFSRKQTLDFKGLDLNALIGNFEKLLRRTIREDIAIHLHLAESLPPIEGDAGQLEQVLMNLVVNAQDAMPDGGWLTIETLCGAGDERPDTVKLAGVPGRHVTLVVKDTGSGMDAAIREKIFEPFFTTKDDFKGVGLGLATVHGIVKQHGGHIEVYSELGWGTMFEIYLPISEKSADTLAPPASASVESGGAETVLLVEDNPQVRDLAFAILKREGYTLLVAESGPAALALLDSHEGPLHLVLTDVVMPEINGRQLFEKIVLRYPAARALYMSGYAEDVIAHHGIVEAGLHFIQKPFSVAALAGKVREVLKV